MPRYIFLSGCRNAISISVSLDFHIFSTLRLKFLGSKKYEYEFYQTKLYVSTVRRDKRARCDTSVVYVWRSGILLLSSLRRSNFVLIRSFTFFFFFSFEVVIFYCVIILVAVVLSSTLFRIMFTFF